MVVLRDFPYNTALFGLVMTHDPWITHPERSTHFVHGKSHEGGWSQMMFLGEPAVKMFRGVHAPSSHRFIFFSGVFGSQDLFPFSKHRQLAIQNGCVEHSSY